MKRLVLPLVLGLAGSIMLGAAATQETNGMTVLRDDSSKSSVVAVNALPAISALNVSDLGSVRLEFQAEWFRHFFKDGQTLQGRHHLAQFRSHDSEWMTSATWLM